MLFFGRAKSQKTDRTTPAEPNMAGQADQASPSASSSFPLPSREKQQDQDAAKNLAHFGVADKGSAEELELQCQQPRRTMHICKRCQKVFSLPFPEVDTTGKVTLIVSSKCGYFHTGK